MSMLRPFIMRSDSELLILFFAEKRMGLLMQSYFASSDGIKSDLRIRCPKSSDFGPKSDDSTNRILKSENGIGLYSSKNLAEQTRPGTAAVRGTHKSTSTSSDRCVGLRIQPRRANAVAAPHRSQTTASCRSTRVRTYVENKESSAPSARLSWLRIMREYTQSSSSRAGLGCFVEKKKHVKRLDTSLRGQTRV